MGALAKKLEALLREAFPPPATIEIRNGDRLIGVVVSTRFKGLDGMQRQDLVWQALDRSLKPREKQTLNASCISVSWLTPQRIFLRICAPAMRQDISYAIAASQ